MRLGIKPINCSQKNSNLNEISPLSLILMQTNTDKHFFAKKVLTDLGHISIIRPALSDEVLTKKMAKQLSWLEHITHNDGVTGSNPVLATTFLLNEEFKITTSTLSTNDAEVAELADVLIKTLDLGSLTTNAKGMREWRNWQTRWIQVPVTSVVRVQVSPSAPCS